MRKETARLLGEILGMSLKNAESYTKEEREKTAIILTMLGSDPAFGSVRASYRGTPTVAISYKMPDGVVIPLALVITEEIFQQLEAPGFRAAPPPEPSPTTRNTGDC